MEAQQETNNLPSESSPKIKISWIKKAVDFFAGALILSGILFLHANLTVTRFWGIAKDVRIALYFSSVQSLALLGLYAIIMLHFIKKKRYFILGGSIIGFILTYSLIEQVREGFRVFFYSIR